jgi:hypothetical protein
MGKSAKIDWADFKREEAEKVSRDLANIWFE